MAIILRLETELFLDLHLTLSLTTVLGTSVTEIFEIAELTPTFEHIQLIYHNNSPCISLVRNQINFLSPEQTLPCTPSRSRQDHQRQLWLASLSDHERQLLSLNSDPAAYMDRTTCSKTRYCCQRFTNLINF